MDVSELLLTNGRRPADDLIKSFYVESGDIYSLRPRKKNTGLYRTSTCASIY